MISTTTTTLAEARLTARTEYTIDDIEVLAKRIIDKYTVSDKSTRFIVTVSGIPGAGKSTITSKLVQVLARRQHKNVILLPQDGFHYYRHELEQMDNSAEAIARRGAPFTYNQAKLLELVKKIKYSPTETIMAPGFSHENKDPIENSICINENHQIIILEGNYTNLKDSGWAEIGQLANDKWMVTSSVDKVRQRLIERHVEAGIVDNVQDSAYRVDNNDLKNARYILEHSYPPDIVIYN